MYDKVADGGFVVDDKYFFHILVGTFCAINEVGREERYSTAASQKVSGRSGK